MKNCVMLAMAVTMALLATSWAGAREAAQNSRTDKTGSTKPELYTVVQVGDEVSAVRKSEVAGLKKSTKEDDKKRKKQYDEDKKAAKTKEEKANLGKPPAPRKVVVLKDSLKSQQDAEDWIDKHPRGSKDKDTGTKTAKKSTAW
jgi:hypothetical protein